MPTAANKTDLTGLALTRTERILVVALSYVYVAPILLAHGKALLDFFRGTAAEARRQIADEERVRRRLERRERAQRIVREDWERRVGAGDVLPDV
ncbi:hypothetical protein WHR41_06589 [Cladosporium halotolerans]|uniref:Uncharacterized protein n=1 Tax=Cladosporium halotolerans TaxID=1052096 RepID=A0AB34KIU2_9PEZI